VRVVAHFVTGRRTKWLVPLIWLVLAAALQPLARSCAGRRTRAPRWSPPFAAPAPRSWRAR